jgi:hypothetical protein
MACNQGQIRDFCIPCLCVCFNALQWDINFEQLCIFDTAGIRRKIGNIFSESPEFTEELLMIFVRQQKSYK